MAQSTVAALSSAPPPPPLTSFGPNSSATSAAPYAPRFTEPAFVVLIAGSLLSVLGCLAIILTFACSKTLRTKIVLRQVFFQSVATLLHSLAYLLSFGEVDSLGNLRPNNEFYCNVQGVLLTTCGLAGFAFNFYIAFDLLSFVGYTPQVKKHRLLFQLLVWPVALLIGILSYVTELIEPVGGFCWVSEHPWWARWLTFYVPLYFVLAFCLFAIFAMPHKLKKMKLLEKNRRIVNTAAAYNAIFLVCWIPASV